MSDRILCVDDEPNVLEAYRRALRRHFDLTIALGAEPALEKIRDEAPFSVIVSDLRMPGMSGVQFLSEARRLSPDSVRIMLTGHADTQAAVDAVNEGGLFRFLTKPCPPDQLAIALRDAIAHHHLILAEKEVLEDTLRASMQVLTETLSLTNPAAFSKGARIQTLVDHMAEQLGLPGEWRYSVAAMLSQIGCVTLPPEVLEKVHAGATLNADEREAFESHPSTAANLLGKVRRLESVAEMIAHQLDAKPITEPPLALAKSDPPALGAQMLRTALAFDRALHHEEGAEPALETLRQAPEKFSPPLVAALQGITVSSEWSPIRDVLLDELQEGMRLERDVRAVSGLLLIARGHVVTYTVLNKLRRYSRQMKIIEPLRVRLKTIVPARALVA